MTKTELQVIAKTIRDAMEFEGRESRSRPERLIARGTIYSVANNIWYDVIIGNDKYRKWYPDSDDWFVACGFQPFPKQESVA